ncbi:hypothetical protein GGX14DRAFT_581525, partial [Mycena pura]
MSSSPRRIVIDDADPAIQYGPSGWFVADATKLNALGNFGPIYKNTSHSTTTDGSTLSFPFNGTSVSVMGTILVTTDNNVTDPTWDCFVDEIKIGNPNPTFQFAENNWLLCDQSQIAPGSHMLTINVQTKGQAFYIDNIFYTPTPDVSYDGAVLEYTNRDTSVSFGSGWQAWGGQNVTQTNGAQVALNFHGTAVTLIGYVPQELPHNSTLASYSIDGGSSISIPLKGLAAGSTTTQYNVQILSADSLTPASHNLVVTYEGDSNHSPLPVGVFYVTNSTTPSSLSSSGSSTGAASASTSSQAASPASKPESSPAGAIAGGIIGCLALIALIVGLVFWCRVRRRRTAAGFDSAITNPNAFAAMSATDVTPYSDAATGPSLYDRFHTSAGSTPRTYDVFHTSAGSTPQTYVDQGPYRYVPPVQSDRTSATPPSASAEGLMASGSTPSHSRGPSGSAASAISAGRRSAGVGVRAERHQDSGIRLDPELVELPPDYS